jgi:hypothetical protein
MVRASRNIDVRQPDGMQTEEHAMAHVWKLMIDAGAWIPVALDGDAFTLDGDGPQRVPDLMSTPGSSLALRRVDDPAGAIWALVVGRGQRVLVNGAPAELGLVALGDRDQIWPADGRPLYFSTETLAQVTPFPAAEGRGFCPRCKLRIDAGTPAVRCPGCGLWYHQSDEFPCWTYAPQCSACPQETALDAGFRWTPEEL